MFPNIAVLSLLFTRNALVLPVIVCILHSFICKIIVKTSLLLRSIETKHYKGYVKIVVSISYNYVIYLPNARCLLH